MTAISQVVIKFRFPRTRIHHPKHEPIIAENSFSLGISEPHLQLLAAATILPFTRTIKFSSTTTSFNLFLFPLRVCFLLNLHSFTSSFVAMSSSSPSPGAQINKKLDSLPKPISEHLPHIPESKEEIKEVVKEAEKKSLAGLRSLAAGGFGGICAVIVGHPFDLVKVRLQTAERGVYTGAFDVVRKGIARDGIRRGLYAGVSAPLVGVTPMFAVSFWGYDVGKNLVRKYSTVTDNQFSVAQVSAAGFFSAIPMTLITAPFERVKVLLQIQGQKALAPGEKPKYSGGVDVVRQLYKEGGIRSVFRGSAATLARDGPGSAAYFATYEVIKRKLTPVDPVTGKASGNLSLGAITCAGAAAGVAMWIPVFPIDTVKSRLQTMEGKPTVGGVIKGLYRNGGLKAFFPGFGPALARAVPANAATFLGVELAHQAMNKTFG